MYRHIRLYLPEERGFAVENPQKKDTFLSTGSRNIYTPNGLHIYNTMNKNKTEQNKSMYISNFHAFYGYHNYKMKHLK